MIEKPIKIQGTHGLHARPAGVFAKKASEFKSAVTLKTERGTANGKSIMSVMGLGVNQGTDVLLTVDGEDEATAFLELSQLLQQ
jgi:phosphocarrier protein HPr